MDNIEALKNLLAAVSHPIRLDALLSISERGEASYTDLLFLTEKYGVKPNILAYHMKRLKGSLSIYKDNERKYRLTDRGKALVKGLASISEGFATREKKQWLQNIKQPVRVTRAFIHALANGFGIADYASNTVVEEVYGKVQSLPHQTIPMTLIIDLFNNSLVEHGLYESLSASLQLGATVSELRQHEASGGLDSPVAREGLTARFLFDYFLQRHLPRELHDAHYLGRINLENGGDPHRPSRIFITPGQLDELWNHEENGFASIAPFIKASFQLASQEVVIVDPQEVFPQGGSDIISPLFWSLLSELVGLSLPRVELVLSYTFPTGKPPGSEVSQRFISNVRSSVKLASGPTEGGFPMVYYLPSSVPFIKEYRTVLEEVVEGLYEEGRNALFASHMSPHQRDLLYSHDGLKAPLKSGALTGIAGFASINTPLLAQQSRGNRSLFSEYVLDATESISKYFVQKQSFLERRKSLSSTSLYHTLEFYHHLNLYSLEETPVTFVNNGYPHSDAISFLLEFIDEVKAHTATLSRDNNLKILVSSLLVAREVDSLFKSVLPRSPLVESRSRLPPGVEGGSLIHGEVVLQRFLDGGYTPTVSLLGHQAAPKYEYLLKLLSEEDLSVVPLLPL